jgi:DNA-binding CsgD family transcriptional regulator
MNYRTDTRLTPRELVLVRLIGEESMSNAEIAEHLRIALPTVKNELYTIFQKLGITTRLELSGQWHRGRFEGYECKKSHQKPQRVCVETTSGASSL